MQQNDIEGGTLDSSLVSRPQEIPEITGTEPRISFSLTAVIFQISTLSVQPKRGASRTDLAS